MTQAIAFFVSFLQPWLDYMIVESHSSDSII